MVHIYLQHVSKGLVELGNLGRNAEVDGAAADFNGQAAEEVGVDLQFKLIKVSANRKNDLGCYGTDLADDLELLALAVLGLGDGVLEALEALVVEFLEQ